jgi:imidazole glycerol-phosphate synthase subunit HisH
MKKIGILNLGINNIKSITNACQLIGPTYIINSYKEFLKDTDVLILPGNGNFAAGMQIIKRLNFDKIIKEFQKEKKTIIGICLGLQLLMNRSEEAKNIDGLSILEGETKKIKLKNIKTPLLGWYTVDFIQNDIENKEFFFNNGYMVEIKNKKLVIGSIANIIPAYIRDGNIHGFQFHPEKSSFNGLKLLKKIIIQD